MKIDKTMKVNNKDNYVNTKNIKNEIKLFNYEEETPRINFSNDGSLSEKEIQEILNGTYTNEKIVILGINTQNKKIEKVIHYKYLDCNVEDLVTLSNGIRVHKKCKEAFDKMKQDAKKDGINLKIVSGYRSTKYQIGLFKKPSRLHGKTQQDIYERARFSAPAGYSEHHTGLAIDINSVEASFANTKEAKWLAQHAEEYGFEMSFPQNNKQGLGFEPWHFRYIGDEDTSRIFNQARTNQ
ncbi:MAG: D-alanyl-D-alanine carboxypeptidase family protein [bacterium]|nr:D-alanyl-D-alanine carboxypeptidase family protein [bacterium]